MYINAMDRNHVDVLVHPFDTVVRMGDFDPALIELFGDVCDAAAARGVAIEINNKAIQRYVDRSPPVAAAHEGCIGFRGILPRSVHRSRWNGASCSASVLMRTCSKTSGISRAPSGLRGWLAFQTHGFFDWTWIELENL